MKEFIDSILSDKISFAKKELKEKISNLMYEKLHHVKMRLIDEMYGEFEELNEANVQRMGRTKLIRVRIRGGKVQRRIKKSAVKGFTIRGGKLIRMSPMERRHRKMAARRAKFKRRAKMKQAIRKRQRSLRKRMSMGIR